MLAPIYTVSFRQWALEKKGVDVREMSGRELAKFHHEYLDAMSEDGETND